MSFKEFLANAWVLFIAALVGWILTLMPFMLSIFMGIAVLLVMATILRASFEGWRYKTGNPKEKKVFKRDVAIIAIIFVIAVVIGILV